MSNNSLSPQIIKRIETLCNEVLIVSEQCFYLSDFNHTGFGTAIMTIASEKLKGSAFAIAESAGCPNIEHGDFCQLRSSCHYLVPQAFWGLFEAGYVVLNYLHAMCANVRYKSEPNHLAYEYLAYMLKKHLETASFIQETVIEELPSIEGITSLASLKDPRFA